MNDSISRQAAIETVKKHYRVDNDLLEVIAYEIEALPSAQLAQDLLNGCTDTISRAAALSALNGLTKIFLNNLPPTIDRADAVDAIKELPSAQPGWIPVTDRLPDKEGTYLCTAQGYVGKTTYLRIADFHSDIYVEYDIEEHKPGFIDYDSEYGFYEVTKVIAWCELPTPYREGGQDNG